ncbi:MAG: GNAT family N-acetyltransferase [Gemmatimonadota bacterium]
MSVRVLEGASNAPATDPANPFLTADYGLAQEALGAGVLWFSAGAVTTLGLVHRGRITKRLELPSMPASAPAEFWSDLLDHCRTERIGLVDLDSFGSDGRGVPKLEGETKRWARTELVLDLDAGMLARASGTHRQRIRQGAKAGLRLDLARSDEALGIHLGLIQASMTRRAERGEAVHLTFDREPFRALLATGSGVLCRAIRADDQAVLASMLVLRSPGAGYDHSSGVAPEGRQCGAQHFLIHETAKLLAAEGAVALNLGGVRETEQSLREFKERFGTRPVDTESIRCDIRTTFNRLMARTAARLKR